MKKYEILTENGEGDVYGKRVYKIRALKSFSDVREGEYGGYVENETNLSQEGNCWIYSNAVVMENAVVSGDSKVLGYVLVHGNASVCDNAVVEGTCGKNPRADIRDYNLKVNGRKIAENSDILEIGGNSLVCGCSEIKHSAKILQRARISGNAKIMNRAVIKGYAEIGGNSVVTGFARVSDHARVGGAAAVKGCAFVKNNAVVKDLCIVSGDAVVMGEYVLDGCKRVNKGVLCGSGNPVAV